MKHENRTTNGKVKREQKFRANKVVIGKESVVAAKADSEEFDAHDEVRGEHGEDVDVATPHAQGVGEPSGGMWETKMVAMK